MTVNAHVVINVPKVLLLGFFAYGIILSFVSIGKPLTPITYSEAARLVFCCTVLSILVVFA